MEDKDIRLLIETNKAILAKIETLNKRVETIESKFEGLNMVGLASSFGANDHIDLYPETYKNQHGFKHFPIAG